MSRKTPAWGSPAFKRSVRKHDRQFARKHGGSKPKGKCGLFALLALAMPLSAVAAPRGWWRVRRYLKSLRRGVNSAPFPEWTVEDLERAR